MDLGNGEQPTGKLCEFYFSEEFLDLNDKKELVRFIRFHTDPYWLLRSIAFFAVLISLFMYFN